MCFSDAHDNVVVAFTFGYFKATSKEIQEESNDENLTKRVVDVKFVSHIFF